MNAKNHEEYNPLPPPPSLTPKPLDADRVKAGNPSVSIIERLASLADKSEVMSLLEFKEEQKLDKMTLSGHSYYSLKLSKIR
ncbi:MAG: hypothetical protein HC930_00455 [Hydrococcus sp. SU_1_0]|nr:hypothetical protein [Hydrococcus sp. SU_1_0]